ncbi:MAG: hypothetical protein E6G64_01855 [Actinobacteria bacterium]|nr:MAG: hypothetical protein E6G64_01855 [Actinomycetota bacterium]
MPAANPSPWVVVLIRISSSAFRHTLPKSSLTSQVARAASMFALCSISAVTAARDVFPTPRSP